MEIEAGGKGDKRKAKPSAVYIWQQEFRVGVGAVWRTAPNSFDSNAVQSKLASPHHKYITHDFHPVKGKQFDGGNQSSSTRRELTASWCRVKLRSLFVPVPVPVSYSYSVLGRTGCTVPTAAPKQTQPQPESGLPVPVPFMRVKGCGWASGRVRPEGDTNVVLIMLVAVVASWAKGKTDRKGDGVARGS